MEAAEARGSGENRPSNEGWKGEMNKKGAC